MEEVGKRLLKLVKRGNSNVFRKIVQHYEQPVYQMSYVWMRDSVLAEDLASDTFIHAYRNISDYKREDMAFSVWLFQIVACFGRKRIHEIQQKKCGNSFLHVSLDERLSLFLYHVYHLSFSDIAKVLGKREAEVKELLVASREQLRGKIQCEEQILSS